MTRHLGRLLAGGGVDYSKQPDDNDLWRAAGVNPPTPRQENPVTRTSLIDALKSALRVWVFTTLGLWIPGLLGWINEVTKWADQKGAPPFPDPSNLGYLFVAALTAAFPAAIAGVVRIVENLSGHAVLPRAAGPETPPFRGEHGQGYVGLVVGVLVIVLLVLLVLRLA